MKVDDIVCLLVAGLTATMGLINLILDGIVLNEYLSYKISLDKANALLAFLLIGSVAAFFAGLLMAALCKLSLARLFFFPIFFIKLGLYSFIIDWKRVRVLNGAVLIASVAAILLLFIGIGIELDLGFGFLREPYKSIYITCKFFSVMLLVLLTAQVFIAQAFSSTRN